MKSAFKYQGLGNDFVMLDWIDQPYREALNYLETSTWIDEVRELTDRKHGIGADGVIVILKGPSSPSIHALIYNRDGSYASFCGNGARCVADYLRRQAGFPDNFSIMMGTRIVECRYEEYVPGQPAITTLIPPAHYLGTDSLTIAGQHFEAHRVDVGNPHLVILKSIELEWLQQHGKELEYYYGKDNRCNVEFVWPGQQPGHYNMLVYERGNGITQACGSGAMAAITVLVKTHTIEANEKITVDMLGGSAILWLNQNGDINLHADAQPAPLADPQLHNDNAAPSVLKSTL